MRPSLLPAAAVPRPALAILQEVFEGARVASFAEIRERLGAPRTTLIRNLGALVEASLAYRDRRDRYVLPRPSTLGLLLVEPDAYVRSLLLHEDVLPALGVRTWAFACLPLRRALDLDLPCAIPVVSPRLAGVAPHASPTIVWHDYARRDAGKAEMLFPSWARDDPGRTRRTLRTLHPEGGLAILAATGDSRMTKAAQRAAKRLDVRPDSIAKAARRLAIEPAGRKLRYPNSVMLPKWLLRFAQTARESSAKERLARDLLGGDGS